MDLTLTLLSVTVFSAARLMLICFWWCVLLCFQDERVKLTEGFRGEMELHVRVNTIWREYILVNDKTKYTLVMFVGDEEFLSFVG
ncbi:hypothetical protein AAZX31_15G100800 [Glycine max]